jgi:uncharacterized protein
MSTAAASWPDGSLDVPEAVARGWRPVPFREFVIKVHQRCNLSCSYCYVYTMADQSWRSRPALMPQDVRQATVDRIAEHARHHDLPWIRVVFHGGEPLLAGAELLATFAAAVRRALPGHTEGRFRVQTNGTLLDEGSLAVLARAGIVVGISLDGTHAAHDRRRRFADGRPSHARVDRAIGLLGTRHPEIFGGLLATIDPQEDPVECYEALISHRPRTIDFLLPHANWSQPPTRRDGDPEDSYGRWLAAVFDRWYSAETREVGIRLFDSLLALLLGGRSRSDQLGLSPVATVVIESDGAVEQSDSLKSAYHGAPATPWNVRSHPLDLALYHPGFVARQLGPAALGPACTACPVVQVCGGGHYAHRFRAGVGFRAPSVYCADLRYLIDHVRSRVAADLAIAR